jgi:hypothetical protein
MFYIRLAVALDLEERDQFFQYILAGGKPKDFKWSSPDRAGTRQSEGNLVQRFMREFKGKVARGDIANIVQPSERVMQAKYAIYADGRRELVGYVWKDTGELLTPEELQAQGRVFMKSRKLQRQKEQ